MTVSVSVQVNLRDIDRIGKRLDKWQGKPLALRMQKALAAGLKLMVGPMKVAAPGPDNELAPEDATGNLRASIGVRALRKRSGEVAAYAVGPIPKKKGYHRHLVILGHRTASGTMTRANPFVDRIQRELEPTVNAFVDNQIRRLA